MLPARRRLPGLGRRLRAPSPTSATAAHPAPHLRDRGLDHAVEKEKHLLPFLNLKDLLLLSSPSPLPLPSISDRRSDLLLPCRPIEFIRLFPSAFLELPPSPPSLSPSISPSPALLRLHSDELRALDDSRPDAASRLLRLLMLSPLRRLPLPLLHRLHYDLGLPPDFPRSLIPHFPHYFSISPDSDLELVCYSHDLALSNLERYASRTGGYSKSKTNPAPLSFPLTHPRGVTLDKNTKKKLEEFQRLPYISPYEDGSQLVGDVADKWTVGVIHELLHLLVGKKTEKENLALLAKHVGIRQSFRKVIEQHPAIFYVSHKLRRQTVVLREAYRRDLLIENHPMMDVRYKYIHLMHKGKDTGSSSKKGRKSKRARATGDDHGQEDEYDEEDDDEEEDDSEEEDDISDTETMDDESDDDDGVDSNATRDSAPPHRGGVRPPINVKRAIPSGPSSFRRSPIDRNLRTSKANIKTKQQGRTDYRGAKKGTSA